MDLPHQSSAMCIIMLGGEDIHPLSATKVWNPIPAPIPVAIRNNQHTTHTSHYRSRPVEIFSKLQRYVPILLSEVEQEQRPSGNGDREAIVVGAGICDGEGERAYTGFAPH